MIDSKEILFPLATAFVLALLAGPLLIPLLRRLKFGQQIRTDGPQGHLKKKGTPTMGGIIIMMALAVAALRFPIKTASLSYFSSPRWATD